MARLLFLLALVGTAVLPETLWAQGPTPGKNTLILRGQSQTIYFYPGSDGSPQPRSKVLFAPGDMGMFGLAVTIAKVIASWGYDVYGLDTRHYLESFTGKTPLKETEVMADFLQIANWMTGGSGGKIALVGWSEGAGLCLLAIVPDENKRRFDGLITFGLTESNTLGWRWSDLLASITKKEPNEPMFPSADYLPKVSPSPLLMIQSSGDQYVSVEAARRLFSLAQEPKRFRLIQAQNHRFEGNQEELYQSIREGLQWIRNTPR